jgi:hypothetical protein
VTVTDSGFFDTGRDPRADIAEALATAKGDGKDVLLVFGARWCPDCTAIEAFTRDPDVAGLLDDRFHVVTVSVGDKRGQRDLNADVEADFNHPIAGGIPSVSVLNSDGKIRFDSADGEFSHARAMAPADLTAFLTAGRD